MVRSIVLFTLMIACVACSDTAKPVALDSSRSADSTQPDTSVHSALLDSLNLRFDTLFRKNFDLKKQDYVNATYYHKAWQGNYFIKEDALTMAVTMHGGFVLNSCLHGVGASGDHNNIVIEIGDEKFTVSEHVMRSDAGTGQEYRTFDGSDAWIAAVLIAEHKDEKIIVDAKRDGTSTKFYELSDRDKQAISDCVDLARTLRIHSALENKETILGDSILLPDHRERSETDSAYRKLTGY